ncbi:MAG: hypothetical protein ACE5I3_05640 [Phycisphaerae bacterium]
MSSRKRRRSPVRKHRLRDRLVLYACLLLVPTVLGGTCGVLPHLVPERRTFGDSQEADRAARDKRPALGQHCLTGAATGGVLGAAASIVYTWASRQRKR